MKISIPQKRIMRTMMRGLQTRWVKWFQDTEVIEEPLMEKQIEKEKELKDKVDKKDYQEFFRYLGINPDDFEEIYESLDFDDCSQ